MQVRILKPAKSAMQSGRGRGQKWVIEPILPTGRVPDPLMGWLSSGDTLNQLRQRLFFDTAEDAARHAKKMGWEYQIQYAHTRKVQPRSYLDNFRKRAE